MTDEIPKPEADLMPLGTVLPFVDQRSIAPGYKVLNGARITRQENPELVDKMWKRWNDNDNNPWVLKAKLFWHHHGGVVSRDFVTLPVIHPDEVTGISFGATYLPPDARPVLAIKTKRTVINDGKASSMDDSNPDAR